MKEVDGRMKLAISALIRSTITPDLELRSGSSQSLSRIARVQPITVLSEWLVVLSSEREKLVKAQHGKKKSQEEEKTSGPACLVTSLEPVLEEITRTSSLNSGDVRHRAALGQVISALVDEMMADTSQEAVQTLLVLLAKFYMDKVMDVLLLHFQPNNSKVPPSVLRSFSQLCSSLPGETIPFCKTIVSTSVLLMKQVKQSDTEVKAEFAVLITKMFEAIAEFTASNTDVDSAISRDDFRSDGDLLYDLMFTVWLQQTKDVLARSKILEGLAAITPFLSKEIIFDKGLGYVSSLIGLYKKLSSTPSAYFEISFCLSQLLSSLSSSESLLLDSTLDPLLTALFQQVCIPVDFSQPKSVKNHFEILKCYDELMKVCSEKILHLVLFKLDLADDKSRLGGFTVMGHIMNDLTKLSEKQIEEVCEKVWTKMNDASFKAQKIIAKIILQLCRRGKLSKEKRKGFIEFMVRLCGCEEEEVGQEGGRVLHLLTTTVPTCEPELWSILLDSLLAEDFTRTVSPVMRSLAILSQQRLDSGNIDMNYGTLRSTVTPYRLMARLVVTASDTANKERTINILKFLQSFSVNINRHLVELWKSRIPLLIHFIEQNNEVEREQWRNWLCAFTTDSINQIGKLIQ